MAHILIVEDDLTFATMLQTWLGKKGFTVDKVSNVAKAVKMLLADDSVDLILSDMRLPDHDGLYLLEWLRKQQRAVPFIVMTSYAEVQNAVHAMKSGASDYIAKPVQPAVLLRKIEEALSDSVPCEDCTDVNTPSAKSSEKSSAKVSAKPSVRPETSGQYLEGQSDAARQLYGYVSLVAPTPMSVLIQGASGTGKEYVARRIHNQSKRASGPFVAIDCGAIPRDVAASEFFGHIKGTFTGAVTDKRGAFVEASGGTLFLDEVGNLSYDVQVQLLRAIQERRVRPLGSVKEIEVDIRLVCATNENLAEAVSEGRFREDLYHRINEFTIFMPELKDRGTDLLMFAELFLRQANAELDRNVAGFDTHASEMLVRHNWPGNLRELKNVVKRATLIAGGDYIRAEELGISAGVVNRDVRPLHDETAEEQRIKSALRATGGNKTKAAILLGIDRKTLYNKIVRYGINL